MEVFQNFVRNSIAKLLCIALVTGEETDLQEKNNTTRERKADSKFSWPNSSEVKFAISLCSNKRSKKRDIFKCATTSGAKNSSSKKLARLLKHLPGGATAAAAEFRGLAEILRRGRSSFNYFSQRKETARAILRQKDQPYSVGPQEDSCDGPAKCPTWQPRPCSETIRERSFKDHDHDAIPPPIKMTDST